MRSFYNIELLFYAGVVVIIFFYVGFVLARFKDEKIILNQHKWIIFTYILLMILTIWIWRYMFDMFFSEKLLRLLEIRMEING